jgi:hypothetical protein
LFSIRLRETGYRPGVDPTTTTDSLGIVTLATAAFKRGRLSAEQAQAISECADDFTRVLSLANRCRQVGGRSLPLDTLPSPASLRRHLEAEDFAAALAEAATIRKHMQSLFQAAERQLRTV